MSMRERLKARKDIYPDWLAQESPAQLTKERENYKCYDCGKRDRTIARNKRGQKYVRYLHASHLHPLDPDPVEEIAGQRLRARCPSCHAKYDHYWRSRAAEGEHQRQLHIIRLEQQGHQSQKHREELAVAYALAASTLERYMHNSLSDYYRNQPHSDEYDRTERELNAIITNLWNQADTYEAEQGGQRKESLS